VGGVVDSERTYHTPQAHLSALVTRQASKVRRYIHLFVASEFACPVEFYFTGVSDVEGFIPKGTHVVSTNNRLIRLGLISAFLSLSSLKSISGGFL